MIKTSTAPASRSIQLEVEVPGTPEQVWRAIATGPGVSAWFTPAEIEERVGGKVTLHMGDMGDSTGEITVWEPPHRFGYVERNWKPDAPPAVSEYTVEPRGEGRCLVRVVNRLDTPSPEWDDDLKMFEDGWTEFVQILRLYLTHFPGQPGASVSFMGNVEGDEAQAWKRLSDALGIGKAAEGDRVKATAPGAPTLSGTVGAKCFEYELLLHLDEPAPGIALLGAGTWEGNAHATVVLFFYGERAQAIAEREKSAWKPWIDRHFPSMKA